MKIRYDYMEWDGLGLIWIWMIEGEGREGEGREGGEFACIKKRTIIGLNASPPCKKKKGKGRKGRTLGIHSFIPREILS